MRTVRNSFLNQNVYADNHLIEKDEHQNWFSKLSGDRDFFFVIVDKESGRPVGMAGCHQIRTPAGSGEISIYLTKENKSPVAPFHAMRLLLDLAFDVVKLDRVFGKFLKENTRAIRFNAAFGFKQKCADETFVTTELTAKDFRAEQEALNRLRC